MPHPDAVPSMPVSILKGESLSTHNSGNVSPGAGTRDGAASPRNATPKSVSIGPVSEMISPLMLGNKKSVEDFSLEATRRSRRPSIKGANSFRGQAIPHMAVSPRLRPLSASFTGLEIKENNAAEEALHQVDTLIERITSWMQEEKLKRGDVSSNTKTDSATSQSNSGQMLSRVDGNYKYLDVGPDFDKLTEILRGGRTFLRSCGRKGSVGGVRRKLSLKNLQRKPSSSDTEHIDNDLLVPSTDVVLDNSKTLNYTGGAGSDTEDSGDELKRIASVRDLDAWAKFKFEILRLIHTLRLKGWRRVSLDMSGSITVQRLSGALTNAVYVVGPPRDDILKEISENDGTQNHSRKPPPKLLLRIYGPQVEHLIDRETELAILRRLARKRIGPRLLGTFTNGRFEEFFHAQPLNPSDLRDPDTSRQIAKRMRELHDGIELLEREREDGPFVWRNWDKWVQRVEQVVSWLDARIVELPTGAKPSGDEAWKRRGFICGVPWKRFREMVERYRTWLEAQYGGIEKIKAQLLFAHNDTQYGNILRLVPSRESPLLMPANSHKQLIVIDFEYSNANLAGLELANHFTEWCYNYHDERKPYACNTAQYPTPEEQERFIRAYVRHRPQFNAPSPQITPQASPQTQTSLATTLGRPLRRPTSSITDFMLDARAPIVQTSNSGTITNDEDVAKASEDADVERLMQETRMWRLGNTAQWVAWGIVQAKVPGMPNFDNENPAQPKSKPGVSIVEDGATTDLYQELAGDQTITEEEREEVQGEEEEFDYLGYAQHRAMFFWADAIQLGFIKRDELPLEVQEKLKVVPY